MATNSHEIQPFEIGLVMAGAISAGAYTAGVMDYLIEALDKWEAAKEKNRKLGKEHPDYDKSIPMHDVIISTLGGASAGGITSIITAIAIQSEIGYVTTDKRNDLEAKKNNLFYDTWVNLLKDDMLSSLLDDSDIEPGKVVSLFNSKFIETIAEKVIREIDTPLLKRNYFTGEVEVIVSLSSLAGIPYQVGFRSDGKPGKYYKMKSYRDFGHFIIQPAKSYDDGRIPIDISKKPNLDILRSCAMATGAFPVGLASRGVSRNADFISKNKFLLELIGTGTPDLTYIEKEKIYNTLVVDGGLMNNEPFEVVQKILNQKHKQTEKDRESYQTFKSSIIMIDPFPSEDEKESEQNEFESTRILNKVIGKIYSAMRGQLLFKPEDIAKAFDPDNASRFMIVPSRGNEEGYKAIACGSFGGFGGFFNKAFREHDFYLGRRNCQKFLHDILTVHRYALNPIFADGYSDRESVLRFGCTEDNSCKLLPVTDGDFKNSDIDIQVPIIPDVSYDRRKKENPEEKNLAWPKIPGEYMEQYKSKVKNRTWKIISNLTKLNKLDKFLLWAGYKLLLSRKINKKVMGIMVKSLDEHGLIQQNGKI